MKKLQKLMNNIAEWSNSEFGKGQRNLAIVYHLKKEVDELIEAIEKYNKSKGLTFEESRLSQAYTEYADCFMLLLDSAFHFGLSADDLIGITISKLEVNKTREWGKPDEKGVVEHIKTTNQTE